MDGIMPGLGWPATGGKERARTRGYCTSKSISSTGRLSPETRRIAL
jgi:hypothetical protein